MTNNNKVTLKDVFEVVNRLEDKMDARLCLLETKVDTLESFRDNLLGKITLVTGVVVIFLNTFLDWLKKKVLNE
jgi:hypothetical protein